MAQNGVVAGYGAIPAAARDMNRRDRFLLSSVLAALAVVSVIAVLWLGRIDHTTSLAEYDAKGIADTYKSDATEKDSYIVVECWGGTLGVPAADSEPCDKKMHDLERARKYSSSKKAGSRKKK